MSRPQSIRESWPGIIRFSRRFWPYLRDQRMQIGLAFGALFAQTAFYLMEPWPLKFIVDRVLGRESAIAAAGHDSLAALDSTTLITVAALSLVVITGLRALAAYRSTVGFALIGNRTLAQIREALFQHLQRLSLAFHHRASSGDLTLRVVADVGIVKEVVVTALLPMLGNLFVLVGMVTVMLWINWKLATVVLVTLPLIWWVTLKRSRKIQEVSRKNRKRESAMAATAAESMTGIRTVQALLLHDTFCQRFASQNNKSLSEGVRAKRLATGLERSIDLFAAIAMAVVLWCGARLTLSHELTPGELLVFLFYLKRSFKPIRDFAKYTARLAKASAAGERVLEILEAEPEVRNRPNAVSAPRSPEVIEFSGVGFAYTPGHEVLRGVSFRVQAGEQVAILGPSGSGKSTLASLLLRLYEPTHGAIMVDGRPLSDFTLESWRESISTVLQDTLLFAATIKENIALGSPKADMDAIIAAARLANAHDFIVALPEGYDTQVGERGVTLSRGQRQRIAIARAAIKKAPILLLDEPTTGLDRANERCVNEALGRLATRRSTLHITHRLDSVSRADRILYLVNGSLVEQGTHRQLVGRDGHYAKLLRAGAGPQRDRLGVPC